MQQHAYSKYNSQPSSQYPQHQYGGGQPVVNLPRQSNQYNTTSQQAYGYNSQAPPQTPASYGASDYGSAPNNNNNPQQSYYNAGNGSLNNDDNNRYAISLIINHNTSSS
jgi:hypothetical protein